MMSKARWTLPLLLLVAAVAAAQAPRRATNDRWRSGSGAAAEEATTAVAASEQAAAGETAAARRSASPAPRTARARSVADTRVAAAEEEAAPPARRPAARAGSLSNRDGQIWREYDLRAYTSRVTETSQPQQAVIDWVLRETGYESWHSGPMALLHADADVLSCYHTPEVQNVVEGVVDRFINPHAEDTTFALRVISIDNPNWRARAQRMMVSLPVETEGVQAWLLKNEDAALLLAELRKRTDYREHSSPNLMVGNGQSTVVAASRTRSYIRDVTLTGDTWPGFQPEIGQIDEGFSLELNPLASLDGATVDAILKCNIDQVERLRPVVLEVPTTVAPRQRTKIEVPQVSHCRLHERFRWPADHVLLIGLGVVATPVPTDPNPLLNLIPVQMEAPRADLLVMIEARTATGGTPALTRQPEDAATEYQGRY